MILQSRTVLCHSIKLYTCIQSKYFYSMILQSCTKYLEQNRVTSKTGQEKKSLVSVFECFLTAIGKA